MAKPLYQQIEEHFEWLHKNPPSAFNKLCVQTHALNHLSRRYEEYCEEPETPSHPGPCAVRALKYREIRSELLRSLRPSLQEEEEEQQTEIRLPQCSCLASGQ